MIVSSGVHFLFLASLSYYIYTSIIDFPNPGIFLELLIYDTPSSQISVYDLYVAIYTDSLYVRL